jgi:hypothetical protein
LHFPVDSPRYKGSFVANNRSVRDEQIVLKFVKNASGSYNVYGKGVNSIGQFGIFGTFILQNGTSGQILLYRVYEDDEVQESNVVGSQASWHVFWKECMREIGWGYIAGDGLISFYYVHPAFAHLKKKELLNQCTAGEHYFTSEEAVQRYAKEAYGWQGSEVGVRLSTMPQEGPRVQDKAPCKRKVGSLCNSTTPSEPKRKK